MFRFRSIRQPLFSHLSHPSFLVEDGFSNVAMRDGQSVWQSSVMAEYVFPGAVISRSLFGPWAEAPPLIHFLPVLFQRHADADNATHTQLRSPFFLLTFSPHTSPLLSIPSYLAHLPASRRKKWGRPPNEPEQAGEISRKNSRRRLACSQPAHWHWAHLPLGNRKNIPTIFVFAFGAH